MNALLATPIAYLKGVGPQKAQVLQEELGIFTFQDLLFHFPYRYQDRSSFHDIALIRAEDQYVQLKGRFTHISEIGSGRNEKLLGRFSDGSGAIDLVWFQGFQWIKGNLNVQDEFIVFGKPKFFQNNWNIPHPELLKVQPGMERKGFEAFYPSTEKCQHKGLHSKGLSKLIAHLFEQLANQIPETLPASICSELNLLPRVIALREIHQPSSEILIKTARYRLKWEELFFLQLELLLRKGIQNKKLKGYSFNEVGAAFNEFYQKHLPFELTNAQKRVLKEIRKDLGAGSHMNRLLQGDVGSGKTLVALLSLLLAIGNNLQGALMAPTEILAQQHYASLSELLKEMPLEVALLTGSTKTAERRRILQGLMDDTIHFVVGTHAIIEEVVQFKNLGLAVIDEQHRFGVAQRAQLWKKSNLPPHVLVMTATPIPRTLAMTAFGDLDYSVMDELPPGRKDIKTIHRYDPHRPKLIQFMREQIKLGRQIYVVYPLIEESAKLDLANLDMGYEYLRQYFMPPDFQISVVHGRMKAKEKDFEMQRFVERKTQIMVATTVIEVGVNVPNASVMVIENTERFGLSQLHQLRGRVGRGAEQSYCILVSGNKVSVGGKTRLQTMVDTNDGFEISEVDLKLRGPGDMMGTKQSGVLDFKIADIIVDNKILHFARNEADLLLKEDEELEKAENINIARAYRPYARERMGWSRIS